jgi:hypothetical protein
MTRALLLSTILLFSTISFAQKQSAVGHKITGDFNGDGKVDTAFLKVKTDTKTKHNDWAVSFNDKTIASIQIGCCDPILINEGDLNADKTTELSIFQAPENGCVYMWTTYNLKNKRWTKLFQPFLIATDCEAFKPADLQNRVFKETGKVYYWDVDPNGENKIRKQIVIR